MNTYTYDTYERALVNKIYDNPLAGLFEELVPSCGKCESFAGEIVRAVSQIGYRFLNDGDWLNVGYGIETVNPAARFLLTIETDEIKEIIHDLIQAGEIEHKVSYLESIVDLIDYCKEYVENNPQLKETETEDMWSFKTTSYDIGLYDTVEEWEKYNYDDDDDYYGYW